MNLSTVSAFALGCALTAGVIVAWGRLKRATSVAYDPTGFEYHGPYVGEVMPVHPRGWAELPADVRQWRAGIRRGRRRR